MSKTLKLIFVAIGLIILGGAMFFIIAGANHFDFKVNQNIEKKTYNVEENFTKISIDNKTADICFYESNELKVEYSESDIYGYEIGVSDSTLKIVCNKKKKFTMFDFGRYVLNIYMPSNKYESLDIDNSTGEITIGKEFSFVSTNIKTSTGDVNYYSNTDESINIKISTGDLLMNEVNAKELTVETSTGNIELNNVNVTNSMSLTATTGKMILTDVNAKDIYLKTSTGKKTLTNMIASNSLTIKASTGDVKLDGCDAFKIDIETSTGDVTGSLLTKKNISCTTDTGKINVDEIRDTSGNECVIKTETGDIKLQLK